MGSLSDYAELELLDHLFNAAYSPVATVYLAFSTSDPDDAYGNITEVSGNNYARTAIVFSAASSRAVVQNGAVEFPQASGAWGTITHWFIANHASNTNFGTDVEMLAHGAFGDSFAPVAGNTPSIATTLINVTIAATATGAGLSDYAVHALLDLMFRNQAFTSPADDTFVMLMTATADDQDVDTDDLTEQTVEYGYARKEVTAAQWDAAAAGVVDNTGVVTMGPPSGGDWGLIVAMAICDALSGTANVLAYDNTNIVDQTPVDGDTVQFAAGALDITMT